MSEEPLNPVLAAAEADQSDSDELMPREEDDDRSHKRKHDEEDDSAVATSKSKPDVTPQVSGSLPLLDRVKEIERKILDALEEDKLDVISVVRKRFDGDKRYVTSQFSDILYQINSCKNDFSSVFAPPGPPRDSYRYQQQQQQYHQQTSFRGGGGFRGNYSYRGRGNFRGNRGRGGFYNNT